MAPKKPTVTSARRRAERASGSTKVAASTPQKRPTTTMQRPFQPGTRTSNTTGGGGGSPSKTTRQSRVQGRVVKGTDTRPSPSTRGTTPSGGGRNLFGGAGDKNTAIKQAGPKAPKPAFKPSSTPFSSPPAVGQTARDLAKAQGQEAVRNAQQRRANLAKVQQDLRGQVGRAASLLTGPAGKARQAIYESVAPRPTSTRANLKEGMAAAKATMKAKAKSADSFGGQYQKSKAGAKPKAAPKMSKAKSFDNAFASARNSGMKTFVWEGKKYNTKMRGEK